MTIVGFNFTKILCERGKTASGKISINNNVMVTNAEETKLQFGSPKEKGLRFEFDFTAKYGEDFGLISLTGEVIYIADEKKAKDILDHWKKNKKLPDDIVPPILNTILARSNVEALILSREIGLPPPMPLPKVNIEQGK